ncbi:ty3-gypsy retrotransposon protein [Cucumis melo var. makuwa]|uniref:Ty3-gypsy retrotransposon protein n=1 Tax=Cucumis melo var. makuwa TaxID=1194695 RepID=A0A5A7UVC1_CUCMM|nr:ty3-gypsy retrotransposon protein [Cucumis melo var. makuwa]TYK30187.1 ty3-gypsy retrotransposon protein [Cucumis melo var. makuwa]
MMAEISIKDAMVELVVKGRLWCNKTQAQQESASVASLLVQQLHDMITITIRAQYRGPPQTSFMYSKLYIKRINNLRMPLGYQPPKFQ